MAVSPLSFAETAGAATTTVAAHKTRMITSVFIFEPPLLVPTGSRPAGRVRPLVADGRRLRAAGETENAARTLQDALSLWHGAPFEDLSYEAFVQGEEL